MGPAGDFVILNVKRSEAESPIVVRNPHRPFNHIRKERGVMLRQLVERLKVPMDL
jgi:hypothetical protein